MATKLVCPVVGTTNTILPPSHPDFDINAPGLVCPVTNATTDHHHNLSKHPGLPPSSPTEADASACPALQKTISSPQNQAMDEAVCPVVGPVTTILPPDHPSIAESKEGDVCPVTKATLGHHEGKVFAHPRVENAAEGAVCPVVGHA
jgi:hypothetical protein